MIRLTQSSGRFAAVIRITIQGASWGFASVATPRRESVTGMIQSSGRFASVGGTITIQSSGRFTAVIGIIAIQSSKRSASVAAPVIRKTR